MVDGAAMTIVAIMGLLVISAGGSTPLIVSPQSAILVGSSEHEETHFWFPQSWASFDQGRTIAVRIQLHDDSHDCQPPTCHGCNKVIPCIYANSTARIALSRDAGLSWTVLPYSDSDKTTAALNHWPLGTANIQLSDTEAMAVTHETRTVSPDGNVVSFVSPGAKLFLNADGSFTNATSSHDIVCVQHPPRNCTILMLFHSLTIISKLVKNRSLSKINVATAHRYTGFRATEVGAANITDLVRWCDVATVSAPSAAQPLYGQVAQLELQPTTQQEVFSAPNNRALTFVTSTDNFTFTFRSVIARHDNPLFNGTSNGPCEAAIVSVPLPSAVAAELQLQLDKDNMQPPPFHDGAFEHALLVVFRVDSFHTYFHSVSIDDGATWSEPQELPAGLASVRPKLHVAHGSPGSNKCAVMLVGGRPGLMMWLGTILGVRSLGSEDETQQTGRVHGAEMTVTTWLSTPKSSSKFGLEWRWDSFNMAEAHNALVTISEYKYGDAWANRTVYPDFSMHGSTSYTSLIALGPSVHPNPAGTSSFVLLYDKLSNGWNGPHINGPYGSEDHVFAMHFNVTFT